MEMFYVSWMKREWGHPSGFFAEYHLETQSIQFFVTLDASADITALLRNNSRTEGAPFGVLAGKCRERRFSSPRFPALLKSILMEEYNAVLAQFINGRIHCPSCEMYEATP